MEGIPEISKLKSKTNLCLWLQRFRIKGKGGWETEETVQRSNLHSPFVKAKVIEANKYV